MSKKELCIDVLKDELWWGGAINHGNLMPFDGRYYSLDLSMNHAGNQANPLLISNKGRYIWSDEPFSFDFLDGKLMVKCKKSTLVFGESYNNLKEVYDYVSDKYFPASGKIPDELLFTAPQYNTWIEMMYQPSESKILKYAQDIINYDMPSGVLTIDDNWQEDYGTWIFKKSMFGNPKAMSDKLHEMGFKLMLWVCPYISPDSEIFRELQKKDFLIKTDKSSPYIGQWWNGYSAVLDCTNPPAVEWFEGRLNYLMNEFGVDGFKFDAGDVDLYKEGLISYGSATPVEHCEAWARIGLKYDLNEYRACWKMAGQPLVQRLSDKNHSWNVGGLNLLIPNGVAQGLMGYAFVCPDMIGGGQFTSFLDGNVIDQELIVRFAQCSALFPMMQFSVAPWRVLDRVHLQYCVGAAKVHLMFGKEILGLAQKSAVTGEPLIQHMAYTFPDVGYENITDQFMLGDSILVAPVTSQGAISRSVVFPEGSWLGDDNSMVIGPCIQIIEAPLSRLPYYRRL